MRRWFEEEREFLVWRSEIEVFSRGWERALEAAGRLMQHDARVREREPQVWRSPLYEVELMPQDDDLGFQLRSRLEVVAQHADE
jgi:hypothetical protein